MTTPVGQIGLSDVNAELGLSPSALITMNDANVRTLAGVGGSGTVISMNDLRGKSNRVTISLTISANTTNYDVYSNRGPSYDPGKSDLTVTINPGVTVYSTSTGSSAFSIPSAFTSGDTITVVNNGVIVGRGGNGGSNGPFGAGAAGGGSGGPGLFVQYPTTFTNNNRIAGGGGGGGGGGSGTYMQGDALLYAGGGGGGGGVANGSGGSGALAPASTGGTGSPGSLTGGGGGGGPGGINAGSGGSGGGYGSSGGSGVGGNYSNGASGGGPGAAVTGNPYITWPATGTRNGPIS